MLTIGFANTIIKHNIIYCVHTHTRKRNKCAMVTLPYIQTGTAVAAVYPRRENQKQYTTASESTAAIRAKTNLEGNGYVYI